jgi:Type II secretion system (T2SS), protein G
VGAPAALRQLGSAKETKIAHQSIERLAGVLDIYKLDVGTYPTTEQGLLALVERPSGVTHWGGPYQASAKIKRIEELLKANGRRRSDVHLAVSPYTNPIKTDDLKRYCDAGVDEIALLSADPEPNARRWHGLSRWRESSSNQPPNSDRPFYDPPLVLRSWNEKSPQEAAAPLVSSVGRGAFLD